MESVEIMQTLLMHDDSPKSKLTHMIEQTRQSSCLMVGLEVSRWLRVLGIEGSGTWYLLLNVSADSQPC